MNCRGIGVAILFLFPTFGAFLRSSLAHLLFAKCKDNDGWLSSQIVTPSRKQGDWICFFHLPLFFFFFLLLFPCRVLFWLTWHSKFHTLRIHSGHDGRETRRTWTPKSTISKWHILTSTCCFFFLECSYFLAFLFSHSLLLYFALSFPFTLSIEWANETRHGPSRESFLLLRGNGRRWKGGGL